MTRKSVSGGWKALVLILLFLCELILCAGILGNLEGVCNFLTAHGLEAVSTFLHGTVFFLIEIGAAEEETVLKLWEGLGYYSRARNLHKCAKLLVSDYGGQFPQTAAELRKLPGIGDYTAGAIASIAFDQKESAVDGNVLRVLARLTGDDTDILSPAAKKTAEATLAPIVPTPRAGDFTQSLIELGALVCTPGEPKCSDCPLHLLCAAHREGRERDLPVRLAKTKRRVEERTVLVIRCTSGDSTTAVRHIALRKRPAEGLLGGLYEFPCMEGHATPEEAGKYLTALGLTVGEITPLPPAKHLFSHIEWRMIGYAVEVAEIAAVEDWFFADVSEVDETYAIPSAYSAYRPYCFA